MGLHRASGWLKCGPGVTAPDPRALDTPHYYVLGGRTDDLMEKMTGR